MRSGLCCSTNSYILRAENRRLPGNGKEMIALVKSVHWWALPNVLHLSEEGAVEIFNRGGAGEWVGFTQMITPHLLTGTLPPPPLNNIRSWGKYSVFSHWLPSIYYPAPASFVLHCPGLDDQDDQGVWLSWHETAIWGGRGIEKNCNSKVCHTFGDRVSCNRMVNDEEQAEEDRFACLSFVGTGPSRVGWPGKSVHNRGAAISWALPSSFSSLPSPSITLLLADDFSDCTFSLVLIASYHDNI